MLKRAAGGIARHGRRPSYRARPLRFDWPIATPLELAGRALIRGRCSPGAQCGLVGHGGSRGGQRLLNAPALGGPYSTEK
jgi:hypothetical protein